MRSYWEKPISRLKMLTMKLVFQLVYFNCFCFSPSFSFFSLSFLIEIEIIRNYFESTNNGRVKWNFFKNWHQIWKIKRRSVSYWKETATSVWVSTIKLRNYWRKAQGSSYFWRIRGEAVIYRRSERRSSKDFSWLRGNKKIFF